MIFDRGKEAGEGNRMHRCQQKPLGWTLSYFKIIQKITHVQLILSSTVTSWASTASVETVPAPGPLSIWRRCPSLSSSPLYFRYLQNYYTILNNIWPYVMSCSVHYLTHGVPTGSLAFANYGITLNPKIPTK